MNRITQLRRQLLSMVNRYNSSPGFDPGDWIELYNPHSNPVDISNWYFSDSDDSHAYKIPDNTIIESDYYMVLCRDRARFHTLFPDVQNYIGDLGFGLDANGELIRLFNNLNESIIVWSMSKLSTFIAVRNGEFFN